VTVACKQQIESLRQMQRDVSEVDATARKPDGMVSVSVDSRGLLKEVVLDPRVYQRQSPPALSRTIMRLIGEACADVAAQVTDLMAPFMPEGFSFDDLDLAGLLEAAPDLDGSAPARDPGPGDDR
jgi:DNA-binding protein YbaB